MDRQRIIEISSATVVRGGRHILDDVSLTVAEGQHTAILGPNGSGKSTLIGLINRNIYPFSGGQVRLFGEERWHIQELRSRIGLVSPALQTDLTGIDGGRLQVFSAVAASFFSVRGLARDHQVTSELRRRAEEALARAGVAHLAGRELATLSSGEARRVLIARALVHRPRALLLDEPCQGLDPGTRRRFLADLQGLARTGTTLILITHHVEEILPEICQTVLLKEGRILGSGPTEKMLTSERLTALFDAPAKVEPSKGWYSASFQ